MFGICLQYTKNSTEAEDVLQDGFIKIFQKISQYRGEGSFEGWMRRIIVNTALEKFRKQNLLYPVSEIHETTELVMHDDLVSEISSKELLNIIQELPPRYRMVFNLYALEGYKHREVAEIMGIDTGTSKSNLARAREILKKRIKILYSEKHNSRIS